MGRALIAAALLAVTAQPALASGDRASLDALIARHAQANGIPVALVHRVVLRESRYNPKARGRGGALGLMQIKHATARALGYAGPAAGLLDPDTNLTYAVRYLAGAYQVAGGNKDRAVALFARGYYYDAKRRGMLHVLARAPAAAVVVEPEAAETTASVPSPFEPIPAEPLLERETSR
jgi:soluble lytic murein transglycosylase-like protein